MPLMPKAVDSRRCRVAVVFRFGWSAATTRGGGRTGHGVTGARWRAVGHFSRYGTCLVEVPRCRRSTRAVCMEPHRHTRRTTCYFPTVGFLLLHNPCLVRRLCLVLVSQQNTEEQKRDLLGGKLSLYGFRALWYVWHAGYCTL